MKNTSDRSRLAKGLVGLLAALSLFPCAFMLLGGVVSMSESGAETIDWVMMVFILSYTALAVLASLKWLPKLKSNRPEIDKDSKMREALKLAQRSQGRLSVIQVATELDLTTDQSLDLLESIQDKGLAIMNSSAQGTVEFKFPDFMVSNPERSLKDSL